MSTRLATGGRLIDRTRRVEFTFNGARLPGVEGDTLASALLANDRMMVGRSFKYHRPRGIVASGAEEPNALMNMGKHERFEPNQRATTTELFDGLTARSQNHWPTLNFDVGAINSRLSRFLPAGFYYKMFIHPRSFWKHIYEPFIRKSAGLGQAPQRRDEDRYEHFHVHVDVLVVGGGIAGLMAARSAGQAGLRVMLIEQTAHWGGRAAVDAPQIDGMAAEDWIRNIVEELESMDNVRIRTRTMGAGVYDHGHVLAYEKVSEHMPDAAGPRQRLWAIRAHRVIAATGAIERPLSFAGNDIPGVLLASAVRDYAVNWAVSVGDRVVVATNNDDAYRTAIALKERGLDIPVILDARPAPTGDLIARARDLGIRVETGKAIAKVRGGKRVTGVAICAQAGEGAVLEEISCDAVAMSGGWSPVVHLWSHCGGKLLWDDVQSMFRPDPARPPLGADGSGFVTTAGSASGALTTADVLADAADAGARFTPSLFAAVAPAATEAEEGAMAPVWLMPQGAKLSLREKMWLDFQNDVKVSDVQLAAREGYESVEHAKRYTTLGMATDQGKLSNINGLAILSDALGEPVPQVGHDDIPPALYADLDGLDCGCRARRSVPAGAQDADARLARGPRRRVRAGRPVAASLCLSACRRNVETAVHREVKNARQALGLLDASTLGKLIVKGPDAGQFLDMLYTNMMSTLGVGKCRYGLMCTENGFLTDDGVVARIDEDTWLCHTTSGRRRPYPSAYGGLAPVRMVGLAGLCRQRHRAIRADRRRRAERAQGVGIARRHGRLERGAALHAMVRGNARRAPSPHLPDLVLG